MRRASTVRPAQQMLNALTGLRAFAAAWVVLYHFRADIKALAPTADVLWPLFDSGYAGVDVFFVLSGFIIAYTYLERLRAPAAGQAGRFLWYRLARLYPVHLFTLAIFAVIVTPGGFRDVRPGDVLSNLATGDFVKQIFLVQSWGIDGNRSWNYPAWSISSEWFAYLVFPLAALALVRVRGPAQALWGYAASHGFNIVTFIWIAVAGYQGQIIGVRIIGEFAAGCFLYLLWRQRFAFGGPWQWLTPGFAVSSGVLTMWVARHNDIAPVVAAPLYGGLIYGLALERDVLSRLLAMRIPVYAGEASYALYMTHAVVQRFTWEYLPASQYLADGRLVRLGILLAWAALLALAAVATYEVIERPSREWMRRLTAVRFRRRAPGVMAVIGGEEPAPGRPAERA